jgi:uncharacterized membrane protein YkoI
MNRMISITALTAAAALAAGASAQTAAPKVVALSKAVSTAETSLGAKAFDAELDSDRGGLVYEIDLVKDGKPIEAEVDAVSGKLVRSHKPVLAMPWTDSDLKAAQTAPRPLGEAIAMIETSTKGRVTDIGLERRAGRHYYEVELAGAQDRDVLVDVQSGAITPVLDD